VRVPLWTLPPNAPFRPVKLGALDDNSDLTPMLHLYVASALPWRLMHEGLPTFPTVPPVAPRMASRGRGDGRR
jgi:hypothetical protein